MSVRTIGVEEELLLVDPETRTASARSQEVLKRHREHGAGRSSATSDEIDQELFRHQLETRTDPVTDLDEALTQVVAARRTAGKAARAAGLATVASGAVPLGEDEARTSPDDRYHDMLEIFGEIGRSGGTCGMHVHVAIESPEEGVAVIDRIAPWLPSLLAITANSPFYRGRDTGYASWRSQLWSRWPSAGQAEPFGSLEGYHEVGRRLQEWGAARDPGMLYFDARLSVQHPTVELRVFDVCADPNDAVLAAALSRGMVTSAARAWAADPAPVHPWRSELLRAAQWRAARHALSEALVHPVERELRPARTVLGALVDLVRPELEESGDLDLVRDGIERVLSGGGAARQRAAYERTGHVKGVVDDLIARTEQSWTSPY